MAEASSGQEEQETPSFSLLNSFPLYYVNKDGAPSGFTHDLATLIFSKTDIAYTSVPLPPDRLVRQLGAGLQDFTILYRLPEVFPEMEFFATLGCQHIVMVPLIGSGITKLADVSGKRVAYMKDGRFDRLYSTKIDMIGMPVGQVKNIFAMAAVGNVDAVVFNEIAFNSSKRFSKLDSGVLPGTGEEFGEPIHLLEIELGIAISRKSRFQHLVPALKDFVESGRMAGAFEPIFRKYGSVSGGKCSILKVSTLTDRG